MNNNQLIFKLLDVCKQGDIKLFKNIYKNNIFKNEELLTIFKFSLLHEQVDIAKYLIDNCIDLYGNLEDFLLISFNNDSHKTLRLLLNETKEIFNNEFFDSLIKNILMHDCINIYKSFEFEWKLCNYSYIYLFALKYNALNIARYIAEKNKYLH